LLRAAGAPSLSLCSSLSHLRHDRGVAGQAAEALDRHLRGLIVADDDL
jgi:hypothetical protein